ncbi:hypothetical protein RIVM261_082930 [Rivularia sp. IAM M-261]|nr:hypothetical protein CAL7716_099520 [Calothrix sp. PCC 7716]GJD23337.1 hypothetical protein RIVM261_082930 [Rivularia sp. IAM M-261]
MRLLYGISEKQLISELFHVANGEAGYYLADLRHKQYYYCGTEPKSVKAKIPNDLLEKIANKKDYEWQIFVTEYPNTPIFILEKYAQSLNNKILANVASHPNTPQKILCQLATADNWSIKYAVAQNPNTPKEQHYEKENQTVFYI